MMNLDIENVNKQNDRVKQTQGKLRHMMVNRRAPQLENDKQRYQEILKAKLDQGHQQNSRSPSRTKVVNPEFQSIEEINDQILKIKRKIEDI